MKRRTFLCRRRRSEGIDEIMSRSTKKLQPLFLTRVAVLVMLAAVLVSTAYLVLSMLHREHRLLPSMTPPSIRRSSDQHHHGYRAHIQIDRAGQLYFRGRELSAAQIRSEVEEDLSRRALDIVGVQADRESRLSHVYGILELLRGVTPGDLFFLTVHQRDTTAFHHFVFSTSAMTETDSSLVTLDSGGRFSLNGKPMTRQEMARQLHASAVETGPAPLVFSLSPQATVQSLADAFDISFGEPFSIHVSTPDPDLP